MLLYCKSGKYGSLQIMFVYGNMHVLGPCLGSSKLQVRHAKQIFNLTKRSCLSFMFCNSINTGHASLSSLHDIGFIGCKLNIKGVWSILDFVLHIMHEYIGLGGGCSSGICCCGKS